MPTSIRVSQERTRTRRISRPRSSAGQPPTLGSFSASCVGLGSLTPSLACLFLLSGRTVCSAGSVARFPLDACLVFGLRVRVLDLVHMCLARNSSAEVGASQFAANRPTPLLTYYYLHLQRLSRKEGVPVRIDLGLVVPLRHWPLLPAENTLHDLLPLPCGDLHGSHRPRRRLGVLPLSLGRVVWSRGGCSGRPVRSRLLLPTRDGGGNGQPLPRGDVLGFHIAVLGEPVRGLPTRVSTSWENSDS